MSCYFTINLILIQCLTLLYTVLSLGIDLPQSPAFPHLEDAAGVHTFTLSQRTPPSIQSTTLYILLSENKEAPITIGNGCPDNSIFCAITQINMNNDEDPIITKKFSISENYTSIHSSPYSINLSWNAQVWGELNVNVRLSMQCLHDDSPDNVDYLEWHGGFAGISRTNYLHWRSKSFCNPAVYDKDRTGRGFFTILLLVIVMTSVCCLIARAWFTTNKMESSGNLFNELMAMINEKFRKIPQFIGEVIKYFGSP